ncbi:hypothetical protein DNTS_021412 [Danionella cerebrum]|uniref:Ig-like domain-containing protein n=1 Tax=Danionella cerebrum TaxID=2873325 RepID=A0A553R133_9TELE|nr:hypothetical protein DNTS_021412 [Danionella translucida]
MDMGIFKAHLKTQLFSLPYESTHNSSMLTVPALLTTLLLITGANAVPHNYVSPNSHHNALTILICVVHDIHQEKMELTWISTGTTDITQAVSRIQSSKSGRTGFQSALSLISEASAQWSSYSCFFSHRGSGQTMHRHHAGFPKQKAKVTEDGETYNTCLDTFLEDVQANRDQLFVHALRILLLKMTIFNILLTAQAIIKWEQQLIFRLTSGQRHSHAAASSVGRSKDNVDAPNHTQEAQFKLLL